MLNLSGRNKHIEKFNMFCQGYIHDQSQAKTSIIDNGDDRNMNFYPKFLNRASLKDKAKKEGPYLEIILENSFLFFRIEKSFPI